MHGHFSAFFWGQNYGGVEPYVVATAFAVFGQGAFVLKGVAVVLFASACLLTYFLARRATESRVVATTVAALLWVWPEVNIWNSTRETGFRLVTICCGLGCVVLSCRISEQVRGGQTGSFPAVASRFGLLGLVAGIGWWASPEILYYYVVAAAVIGAALLGRTGRAHHALRAPLRGLAVAIVGFTIGAMPWLWDTARNGLGGLRFATLGPTTTYPSRLEIFFRDLLPLMLGLRREGDGAWVLQPATAAFCYGLLLLLIAVSTVVALRRGGLSRSVAVGLLAFPLLYAFPQRSSFWYDGRFGIYVLPLVGIVLGLGGNELWKVFARSAHGRRALHVGVATILAGAACSSIVAFAQIYRNSLTGGPAFFENWGDPNGSTIGAVDRLRASGIRTAYGDYWVATVVGFFGREHPVTAAFDTVRNAQINRQAFGNPRSGPVAWLFFDPRHTVEAVAQFSSLTVGPNDKSGQAFESDLKRLNVAYRVMKIEPLEAIVPTRVISPQEVGIPASLYTASG